MYASVIGLNPHKTDGIIQRVDKDEQLNLNEISRLPVTGLIWPVVRMSVSLPSNHLI